MSIHVLGISAFYHDAAAALGRVNPWSRTPLLATALVALVVLLLAWATPIEHLAGGNWTSWSSTKSPS